MVFFKSASRWFVNSMEEKIQVICLNLCPRIPSPDKQTSAVTLDLSIPPWVTICKQLGLAG
jgi:hypothetical protein